MMGLDIVVNHPDVSVRKLHLWTFGAPQVADEIFLQSALRVAPRLRFFVNPSHRQHGRYHRYVTVSDRCQIDLVSTITSSALPAHRPQTWWGRLARRMGGLRGAIVHLAEPHILLTPEQASAIVSVDNDASTTMQSSKNTSMTATTTRSSISAHATVNYLRGISRESREHPLSTDLPPDLRQWMGEPL